jgi:hypothetical protein
MAMEQWHLSKSVPLTLIAAIIGQTLMLGMWINSIQNGIETNAKEIARHETAITSMQVSVQGQAVALARIEENVKAIRVALEKIADKP